jgi:hypothetical protein
MVEEAQGPINFTMLLTLFGDRLNGKYFFLIFNLIPYNHYISIPKNENASLAFNIYRKTLFL